MRARFRPAPFAAVLAVAGWEAAAAEPACQAAVEAGTAIVEAEHGRWQAAIDAAVFDNPDVKAAYAQLIDAARVRPLGLAPEFLGYCEDGRISPEEAESRMVDLYSKGLMVLMPQRADLVSPEEIRNGYPSGGPDAFIEALSER